MRIKKSYIICKYAWLFGIVDRRRRKNSSKGQAAIWTEVMNSLCSLWNSSTILDYDKGSKIELMELNFCWLPQCPNAADEKSRKFAKSRKILHIPFRKRRYHSAKENNKNMWVEKFIIYSPNVTNVMGRCEGINL